MIFSMKDILIILFISLLCIISLNNQTSAQVTYVEDFADPLGNWTTDWFYQNTNAENYYVASGADCDPNYRGNEPNGMWISDDRGCDTIIIQNPVRINFLNNFGDDATLFSIDVRVCLLPTMLNIYDRNGTPVVSESLPSSCSTFATYSYSLNNGISAFELDTTSISGNIEGNTAIDNVTIRKTSATITAPTMTEWGMIIFMVFAFLGSLYYIRRKTILY